MYKFELPINERTRRLISIENIFLRLNNQIKSMVNFSEVGCFESYFNIQPYPSGRTPYLFYRRNYQGIKFYT